MYAVALAVVWNLALLLLPAYAHTPVMLDARRATPGMRLELVEMHQSPGNDRPRYLLQTYGLPPNGTWGVWVKDFGHSFHQFVSGLKTDQTGIVVSSKQTSANRPTRLEALTISPGPYPWGAVWEVAVVSSDHTNRVFAKTVPYPISAHDGSCRLSLEIVSLRGTRFVATGTGFAPGENVITESSYGGRVIQKPVQISPEGELLPEVIMLAALSDDRSARYTVKGRSCEVGIDYEWGGRALIRR